MDREDEEPPEAPPVRSSSGAWPRWVGGIGGALLVAGAAVGGWSLTLSQEPDRPALEAPLRATVTWTCWLVGALGLGLVLEWVVRVRPAGDAALAGRLRALTRWVCGLAATCTAVVAGLALVQAVTELRRDVDGGVPRAAMPLLTAGAALVASGAACLAEVTWWPRRPWASRSPRGSVALTGTCVLVAVVVVTGSVAVARRVEAGAVEATTSSVAPGPPMEGPPREVLWAADLPATGDHSYGDVPTVVAAGEGVAVGLDDGVRALDPGTGRELWHYRRPGAHLSGLVASPAGRWLLVTLSPRSAGHLTVVLDGRTGAVEAEISDPDDRAHDARHVTDRVVVAVGDGGTVRAFDPSDMHQVWEWPRPADCDVPSVGDRLITSITPVDDAVLVAVTCDETDLVDAREAGGRRSGWSGRVRTVALDDRTGAERWRHEGAYTDMPEPERVHVAASPGGRFVELRWYESLAAGYRAVDIDVATGRVVRSVDDPEADPWLSDAGWLAAPRFGDGPRFTLGDGRVTAAGPDCARYDEERTVALADALVRLCREPAGWSVAVIDLDDPDRPGSIALPLSREGDVALFATPTSVVAVSWRRVVALG